MDPSTWKRFFNLFFLFHKILHGDTKMNDPKAAINAILDDETTINHTTVYPITLARYALLELVESPFIGSGKDMSISNILPSLYIMTHDKSELKGITSRNIDSLYEKATEWADEMGIDEIPEIIKEVIEKVQELMKVAPTSGSDDDGPSKKN